MNWIFVWNNYTEEDVKTVNEEWIMLPDMRCIVYEKEVGASGTAHLQGFFVYRKIKSWKQVKGMISPKVHFAQMKKCVEANLKYCSKNGDIVVIGDVPESRKDKGKYGILGKKSGIKGKDAGKDAPDIWEDLLKDIKSGMTRKDIMEKYIKLYAAYHAGIEKYIDMFTPREKYDIEKTYGSLYIWQRQLLDIIALKPDSRSVIWIYSERGNAGKSAMFKHLICMDDAFEPFMNATTRDLSCAWKGGHAVFDFARDDGGSPINYAFMEMVKNGYVFSAKYESKCKRATNITKERHVICFSNNRPETSKLSKDRWALFRIDESLSLCWEDVL